MGTKNNPFPRKRGRDFLCTKATSPLAYPNPRHQAEKAAQ
ncbi:hypothetical protein HMPREF9080_00310 [Cardiobacterium valvarum F0432]|uniref:Uncharacterized protein n=1 Tax=Cardiobacterium valvarum F0432 TaxID=797473 RepID=G9ZC33_9GAMM|nr:hypothetical protein HMPREF9080_00310 [Cardiobacterium valvarum F0432]